MSQRERRVVGFLGYHRRTGRTHFVDHIHVDRDFRQQGHTAKLLRKIISTGPVELIVRRNNHSALASYLKLGFCTDDKLAKGAYKPGKHELAMRTVSYKKSQVLMDRDPERKNKPTPQPKSYDTFAEVPDYLQKYMIKRVMETESKTRNGARGVLSPQDYDTDAAPVRFFVLTVRK